MNIFALSTGRGPSGIAILRLSGKDSLQISKLITKKNDIKSKEINLCKFHDPSNGKIIDEGLLLWFPGPNSYTGEDLAEFHTHGSNAVVSCFLRVLSEQENCRLAEPGEFTKIAFQNNKIDLIEAESIADLIHAETELQRQQAIKLVQGNASNYYNSLREKLVKSLSYIEAKIDFAEDDLPENVLKEVQNSIKEIHKDIKQILEDQKIGEKIRDGFKISIVGQVNSGKSSLLNLLSKREAAIVSEEEGTTRDVIETYLNIDGYPVILADTAGIRKAKNKVEKEGIQRAIKKAKNADLTLVMIDNSLKQIDKGLKKLINENCILVFNKSDLNKKIPKNEFTKNDQILISVKDNQNIDKLVKRIKDKLSKKFINANNILVTRERHRAKLNDALKEIEKFLKKDQQKEIETAAEDLRLATRHLGSIVGKVDVEEILGSIFQDFCIGK
ncbi:MAG: tRNA uridine-5-carboxymethylaminomethyl(34) synthesis GTPase MnmE [Pelagibacteraceae bacterium]|nr:tRNA uridine-5-carboxymethylaminomethyl(34) synthesis GTPase MnmE [Pelagibacteraceae bacterium]